jgi:Ca2+-binding RTX toxin-like protein
MAITITTTATKRAITEATNTAKLLAANTSQLQNQSSAADTTTASSGKSNPPQGFGEPSSKVPEVSKPGYTPATAESQQAALNKAMGVVSQADALNVLVGKGASTPAASSATTAVNAVLAGSSKTDKPATDQGFANKPDTLGTSPVTGLNPMAPYQGGSLGGLLGAAAQSGVKTLSDFNKTGMIADGDLEPSAMSTAGAVAAVVTAASTPSTPTIALVTALQGGAPGLTLGSSSLSGIVAGGAGAMATAGAGVLGAFTVGAAVGTFIDKVFTALAGKSIGDKIYEGTHPDEDAPATKPTTGGDEDAPATKPTTGGDEDAPATKPTTGGGVSIPDPDSRGGQVSVLSGAILDQLRAAQTGKPTSQGGSGDATPVDDGGIPQVVNNGSIAVNQGSINQRNLVGQPGGGAIGENVSGGNKGLGGFTNSNGAGAINPGPDGGNPSGDSRFQQDPAAALGGNQPAPEFPSAVGSQESQTSSVTTTLAAGARNLTLTGTALINGTGNVLSNLINGNSAANELRGEAGNDSLDGKAGNDLLDGGAGRDLLTGGSGADRFRFATAGGFGTAQADRIIDFSRSEGDRIELSRSAFGLSAGAAVSFQAVNSDADLSRALSSSTLLVQDLRDGSLLFNQNGTAAGAGQGGVFALVSQGLTLQAGDLALVA